MRERPVAGAVVAAALLLLPSTAAAADPPAWLQQAARTAPSALEERADAVVLLDDLEVVVSDDGRSTTTRRRYAVKVLTRDGTAAASLREIYTTDAGRVRAMRGWTISDGRGIELGNTEIADVALVDNDVYNESRARVISGQARTDIGAVFGAETEIVERTAFTQFDWLLQEQWPVRAVRRTLTLPSGWEARSLTFNHGAIAPVRSGGSYVWSAENLPGQLEEVAAPPASSVVPRIVVTYFDTRRPGTALDSWDAVSRWLAALSDAQSTPNAAIAAKAREITSGAASYLERLRAVAQYVQRVHYISIQTGIGRGGGYSPRAAADVLAKNYGDCKDKATLMRAMLDSLGLHSQLVVLYAGDPDYVRREWPSPQQFNHAIVAISVPADVTSPAVLEHPSAGRLLMFDPTDEHTPLGRLPAHEQGGFALVVNAQGGALVRLPEAPPESSANRREIDATLNHDGMLIARLRLSSTGDPARQRRFVRAALSDGEHGRLLESDLRRGFPAARLTATAINDDLERDEFELRLQLAADGYAQVLQGRGMILRPPQMPGGPLPALAPGVRTRPVVLDAREEVDEFVVTIPAALVADDLPQPRAVDAPFGRFSVQWTAASGRLTRIVSLRLVRSQVPPDQYGALRAFLDAFREAERAPVFLARP